MQIEPFSFMMFKLNDGLLKSYHYKVELFFVLIWGLMDKVACFGPLKVILFGTQLLNLQVIVVIGVSFWWTQIIPLFLPFYVIN